MQRAAILALACALPAVASARADATARPALLTRSALCTTTVTFGEPTFADRGMVFRGIVTIACPPGVSFSAAFRSLHACRLLAAGDALHYELFSDPAMHSPLVSCEREPEALRGSGRQSFIVYGRVEDGGGGIGRFRDSLLATVST